jgi:transposase InsO family protein
MKQPAPARQLGAPQDPSNRASRYAQCPRNGCVGEVAAAQFDDRQRRFRCDRRWRYLRPRGGISQSRLALAEEAADPLAHRWHANAGVPDIVHSDRGSTYATTIYLDLIRRHEIRQSMSRKGDCWDMRRWKASSTR